MKKEKIITSNFSSICSDDSNDDSNRNEHNYKRSSKFYPTTRIISFEEEIDYILSHLKNPFG
jgi:hypothetical protein